MKAVRPTLAIRPERLRLTPNGAGVPARLRGAAFLGERCQLVLDVAGLEQPLLMSTDASMADAVPTGGEVMLERPAAGDALLLGSGPLAGR